MLLRTEKSAEIRHGFLQSILQRHGRLPPEFLSRQSDVGAALQRVVLG